MACEAQQKLKSYKLDSYFLESRHPRGTLEAGAGWATVRGSGTWPPPANGFRCYIW